MNDLWKLLEQPLFKLAGNPVSIGSLLTGAFIVVAAVVVTTLVSRALGAVLRGRGVDSGVTFAIVKILRYVMIVVGLFVAANSIGIRLDAVIAASAALAVGIGFGLQNVTQNFISGIILLIEQPVRKGDFVRIAETSGTVDDVGLRATRIVTRDEISIIVPNSKFVTEPVINCTRPTNRIRIRIEVGVAYGTDTALARETLLAVASRHERVLAEPPAEVRLEKFGDSSLDLALLVWIESAWSDLRIASDLRFAIDDAFRKQAITIPFPQRELRLIPPTPDAASAA